MYLERYLYILLERFGRVGRNLLFKKKIKETKSWIVN